MKKISWKKKINPLWWFGNIDDPNPPDDKWVGEAQWYRKLRWFLRNPFHNFTFYVIGLADRMYLKDCYEVWNRRNGKGVRWNIILPFISYKSERYEFYIGWRGDRCNFGIKFNRR